MADQVRLIITSDSGKKQELEFEEPQVLRFGRARNCDVSLSNDRRASRYHFELEVDPPQVRLYDLGSLHGTWVNGVKYGGRPAGKKKGSRPKRVEPPVILFNGDKIEAGKHQIQLSVKLSETIITTSGKGKQTSSDEKETIVGPSSPAFSPLPTQADVEIPFDQRQAAKALASLLDDLGMNSLQESAKLSAYRIYKRLGKGAFGHVYLARHQASGQWVALKTMRPTENQYASKAFLREIELARDLRHPNIVQLLDDGAVGKNFYFVMEYCDGGDLIELMRQHRGLIPLPQALPLMQQILQGLAFMHLQGIVHRDLKPSNILLTKSPNGVIPKISDLGLAKGFLEAGLTNITIRGMKAGTRPYMSVEQLADFKYAKPISDVWSIGATFYFILTGYKPRQAPKHLNWQMQILRGKIIPIRKRAPKMPSAIADIIDRSLARDTNMRYKTAAHMLDALEKVLRSGRFG